MTQGSPSQTNTAKPCMPNDFRISRNLCPIVTIEDVVPRRVGLLDAVFIMASVTHDPDAMWQQQFRPFRRRTLQVARVRRGDGPSDPSP